jgi:trehalose 6-phosphate synthase
MRLVTLSNSCPRWEAGSLLPRSPGGLVPMLIALLTEHGGHWIFTAAPDNPAPGTVQLDDGVWLYPMSLSEDARRQHYDTITIGLFLGLLHYMHDTSVQPVFDASMHDAWSAYEEVNRAYASRLSQVAQNEADELILINDPHLMLVPAFYADLARRESRLAYFLGTPWCEPDYFGILPEWLRVSVLESLLHCDVVGFHAARWADAFLACCARYLPGARAEDRTVTYRGRRTKVVAVPFPLDVGALEQVRDEPATRQWEGRLAGMARGRRIMTRADRIDLWKNLPRGFAAYEAMLERRPSLAGECWFGAVVTVPSRPGGRQRAYQELCEASVRRINERFGSPGQEAVSLVYPGTGGDSRNCVVAALGMCDAVVVNSTYDGLNLVAKEASLLISDRACLLLSVNAGVYEQLGPYAVRLDPFDLDQTSRAMEAALDGTSPGSAGRAAERRDLMRKESAAGWLAAVFG